MVKQKAGTLMTPKKNPWVEIVRCRYLYLLLLPALLDIIIFHYVPIYGAQIAFKDYSIGKGIMGSEWIGLKNFTSFFSSPYFWPLLRNTLLTSLYSVIWGFPVPILLAILLNETKSTALRKTVQTISYMPYFISTVIVIGLLRSFLSPSSGIVNVFIKNLGFEPINFMGEAKYFRSLYVFSGIWQGAGFSAIIYISAIAGIDPELYNAASIDGAGRLKQIWHITLPGILPTISIMLIMRIGGLLGVDWQKILLMSNDMTTNVAEVIQTFTYKRGLINADYGYATAVGLFTSVIGFMLVVGSNWVSKKLSGTHIF